MLRAMDSEPHEKAPLICHQSTSPAPVIPETYCFNFPKCPCGSQWMTTWTNPVCCYNQHHKWCWRSRPLLPVLCLPKALVKDSRENDSISKPYALATAWRPNAEVGPNPVLTNPKPY